MTHDDWIADGAARLAMEGDPNNPLGIDFQPRARLDLNERATDSELAEMLLAAFFFKVNKATGELVVFKDGEGVYVPAVDFIKSRLERSLPDITKHRKSEVIEKIKDRLALEAVDFDTDKDWLHCANGWVNILTGEFQDHSPDRHSLHKLPVAYKAGATCPEILKFLDSTLDPESVAVVLRMIGYSLLKDVRFQKSFMLIGEGSNGKSTLIKLIKALFGKHLVASQSLQDLSTNRFKPAELYGKMVNLFSDLPSDRLSDVGYFKMLSSGDPISAEKKYGQPFSFENHAKLIFSANHPPKVNDDEGYAYWRRWILVNFTRTFEGENDDPHMLDKITTPEELSGLLYWSITMLKQLMNEHGFEETDWQEIKQQYALGASNIKDFIKEFCVLGEDQKVKSLDLQEALCNFCKERGQNHIDPRQLGKELDILGIGQERIRKSGVRVRFYVGIGLKCPTVPMSTMLSHTTSEIVVIDSEEIIGTTGQAGVEQ